MSKLLLIGLEGLQFHRLKLMIEQGHCKTFASLIEQSAVGSIKSPQPLYAQHLWATALTGTVDNSIVAPVQLDNTDVPVTSYSWSNPSIFSILAANNNSCHTINFPATYPALDMGGVNASELFFAYANRPAEYDDIQDLCPVDLHGTFDEFKLTPEDLDGQTMHLFVPEFQSIDNRYDNRLYTLANILASDLTKHAVVTWAMENLPWQCTAIRYNFFDTIARLAAAYTEPSAPWIHPNDKSLYAQVLPSAYRLADMLLYRLQQLAGEDTAVIVLSPFGARPGNQLLPKYDDPISELLNKRTSQGVVAIKHPSVEPDTLMHGTRLIDIVPTILDIFHLQKPPYIQGNSLLNRKSDQANLHPTVIPKQQYGSLSEQEKQLLIPPIYALLNKNEIDKTDFVLKTKSDHAIAINDKVAALECAEQLHDRWPFSLKYGMMRLERYYQCNLLEPAYDWAQILSDSFPDHPMANFFKGIIAYVEGNYATCVELLEKSPQHDMNDPAWGCFLGNMYLKFNLYKQAYDLFSKLHKLHPEHSLITTGLANACYECSLVKEAGEYAMLAISQNYSNANAHLELGKAMLKLKEIDKAIQSFKIAQQFMPNDPVVYKYLSTAYGRKDKEQAKQYSILEEECVERHERARVEQVRKLNDRQSNRENSVECLNELLTKNCSEHVLCQLVLPEDIPQLRMQVSDDLLQDDRVNIIAVKEKQSGQLRSIVHIALPPMENTALVRFVPIADGPMNLEAMIKATETYAMHRKLKKISFRPALSQDDPLAQLLADHGFVSDNQLDEIRISITPDDMGFILRLARSEKSRQRIGAMEFKYLEEVSWDAVRLLVKKYLSGQESLTDVLGYQNVSQELSSVAIRDGKIIGVLLLIDRNTHIEMPFFVIDDHHRGGLIAASLMAYSEIRVKKKGYTEMTAKTSPEYFPASYKMLSKCKILEHKKQGLFHKSI